MNKFIQEVKALFPILSQGKQYTTIVQLHREVMDLVGESVDEKFLTANIALTLQGLDLMHPTVEPKWPNGECILEFLTQHLAIQSAATSTNLTEVAFEIADKLEEWDINSFIKPKNFTTAELAALTVAIVELENGELEL